MLTTIIITILLGAFAGWVASKLTNRDAEQGAIGNIVVGILGALLGTAILNGFDGADGWIHFDLGDVIVAILGATLLSVLLNLATRKRIR